MSKQLAYHFTGHALRDGKPIPAIGEWLVHTGPLVMCKSGLHASIDAFDALRYAPGELLHRVEMGGKIIKGDDKLVASKRKIIATIDATELLRSFARQCALDVIHLWDAPPVVVEYLKTGDEKLRAAAWAASDAARAAAWAARAASDAAWAAAWAARAAASDAARAASDAAWAAAWAARAAASDAAWAASDAAWAASDAAWAAARATQRKRFNQMVVDAFKEVS